MEPNPKRVRTVSAPVLSVTWDASQRTVGLKFYENLGRVTVSHVTAGSPAEYAGVIEGLIVTAIVHRQRRAVSAVEGSGEPMIDTVKSLMML